MRIELVARTLVLLRTATSSTRSSFHNVCRIVVEIQHVVSEILSVSAMLALPSLFRTATLLLKHVSALSSFVRRMGLGCNARVTILCERWLWHAERHGLKE